MAIKPVQLFLLGLALCAFSACEKQSASTLEAMKAHHHAEEHAYENPKAEAEALGEKPAATATPSATPTVKE